MPVNLQNSCIDHTHITIRQTFDSFFDLDLRQLITKSLFVGHNSARYGTYQRLSTGVSVTQNYRTQANAVFKPPPPVGAGGGYMFSGRPSVRASVRASVRP